VRQAPPNSECDLLVRAEQVAGLTLEQLAHQCGSRPPQNLRNHKGWVGELLEIALGAGASSRPVPDFEHLGIELKTIPLNHNGQPRESTHVCTVQMNDLVGQHWRGSAVYAKLRRVLWMPIEALPSIPLGERRIGRPIIWSPSVRQEQVLREDWEEQVEIIATGRMHELDARLGTYLQVRPKAANSRSLAPATDADGAPAYTLPRGFYLRPALTRLILDEAPD
jgi:DNA mismatch repair protein MutH